jgi:predicted DNA binding CopG/RHH family protein
VSEILKMSFELSVLGQQPGRKKSNMKKEYDLKKLKKRPGAIKVLPDAAKIPISIRLDGSELAEIRTEAERLGVPYQTLISSILHRYVAGELVDRSSPDLKKLLKQVI